MDADLLHKLASIQAEKLATVELVLVCGLDEVGGGWEAAEEVSILAAKLSGGRSVIHDWDSFLAPHAPDFEWPLNLDEDSPCALCFTSGTTGNAKGVVYSQRAVYLHTLSMCMADQFGLSGADVLMPVVPYVPPRDSNTCAPLLWSVSSLAHLALRCACDFSSMRTAGASHTLL